MREGIPRLMHALATEVELEATLHRLDHLIQQVDACLVSVRRRERRTARLRRRRHAPPTAAA